MVVLRFSSCGERHWSPSPYVFNNSNDSPVNIN
jgi:hypothetical protein